MVKDLRKVKDLAFGGAMALEASKLLNTTDLAAKTDIVGSMVGIGAAGVVPDIAFRVAIPKEYRKKKRR